MLKHTTIKFAAALGTLVSLAITTGCGETIMGLDEAQTAEVEKIRTGPPVILPVDKAPAGADLTGDGIVDAADMAAFAATLLGDLNGDREVDDSDLALLGSVVAGKAIDRYGDGRVDASDFAAHAYAKARADLTGNGVVDAADLAAFAAMRARGDVNEDGIVSSADLETIRKHAGQEVGPMATGPQ